MVKFGYSYSYGAIVPMSDAKEQAHRIKADTGIAALLFRQRRECEARHRGCVGQHQRVGERVQMQRVVQLPEHWLRFERHRAEVRLLQQRRAQVLERGVRRVSRALHALVCGGVHTL